MRVRGCGPRGHAVHLERKGDVYACVFWCASSHFLRCALWLFKYLQFLGHCAASGRNKKMMLNAAVGIAATSLDNWWCCPIWCQNLWAPQEILLTHSRARNATFCLMLCCVRALMMIEQKWHGKVFTVKRVLCRVEILNVYAGSNFQTPWKM